jgi:hypothetical protein
MDVCVALLWMDIVVTQKGRRPGGGKDGYKIKILGA